MGAAHCSVANQTQRPICVITFNMADLLYKSYHTLYIIAPGEKQNVEANPDAVGLKLGVIFDTRSDRLEMFFHRFTCQNDSVLTITSIDGDDIDYYGEGTSLQAKGSLREQDVQPFNMAAATLNRQYANPEDHKNKTEEDVKRFFREVKNQSEQAIKTVTGKDVNLDFINGNSNNNASHNSNSPMNNNASQYDMQRARQMQLQQQQQQQLFPVANNHNFPSSNLPPSAGTLSQTSSGASLTSVSSSTKPPIRPGMTPNPAAAPPTLPLPMPSPERKQSISGSPKFLQTQPTDILSPEEMKLSQEKWEAELERVKKEKRWEGEVERIRRERQLREEQERLAAEEAAAHPPNTAPVVNAGCHVCIVS